MQCKSDFRLNYLLFLLFILFKYRGFTHLYIERAYHNKSGSKEPDLLMINLGVLAKFLQLHFNQLNDRIMGAIINEVLQIRHRHFYAP